MSSQKNKVNVVAYCRVSTEHESQAYSLENQASFFQNYCKEHDLNLVHIYADKGISGLHIKKREQLKKLLADSDTGLFTQVLCKDISRFSRNTVDLLESIRYLKSKNINVVFITSSLETLQDSELILTLSSAIAQEESINISKRIKFTNHYHASQGKVPNRVYGYDRPIGDIYHLSINSEQASVVQLIFDLYVNEHWGMYKIARHLNEVLHIKSYTGGLWNTSSVFSILHNEIYKGVLITNKTYKNNIFDTSRQATDETEQFVFIRPEFRIVSDELFDKAQSISTGKSDTQAMNKVEYSPHRASKFTFSGLITCGVCGWHFKRVKRTSRTGAEHYDWKCGRRHKLGVHACTNSVSVNEQDLIAFLDSYFSKFIDDRQVFVDAVMDNIQTEQVDINIDDTQQKISQLKRKKEKLLECFYNDIIDIKDLKIKTKELDSQIQDLELKLAQADIKNSRALYDDAYEKLKLVWGLCVSTGNMTKGQLAELITNIVVNETGEVEITLNV